jgi:energy-coupling factor transport system substrate-specific component
MKFIEQLKKDFSTVTLVLIPIAIGISLVGEFFCLSLRLPLWLNCIGSMLVGIVAGPWAGLVTGVLTNVVAAFTIEGPTSLFFAHVNGAIGLVAGFLAMRGMFKTTVKGVISGFILALVNLVTSAPVAVIVFGGITAGGGSVLTAVLLASGQSIWKSVITSSLLTDTADKILSAVVAYLVIRSLPKKYLAKFSRAPITTNLVKGAETLDF